MPSLAFVQSNEMTWRDRLRQIHMPLVFMLTLIAGIGVITLYSAAQGSWYPWAQAQALRFGMGLAVMIAVSIVDLRIWLRYAYLAYFISLILLVIVDVFGSIGMGAQRWIDLGFIQLQPSELMKIALIMSLARYFSDMPFQDIGRIHYLIPPLILVFLPIGLVLKQPDLGTAMMLLMSAGAVFFLAGVRMWKFAVVIILGVSAVPVAWNFLHDYQQNRVLTFLDPDRDPKGAGYHITQSKIALGSGGVMGKGFMEGTQSRLNFLPEKQTDFIFTMFAEEWGLFGCLALMGLYLLLIGIGYGISLRCRNQFGRLLALGTVTTFFLYFFINTAMVMGLVPVVGVPLPLFSYGGTSMLSLMFGWGLVMSVWIHRDTVIGGRDQKR